MKMDHYINKSEKLQKALYKYLPSVKGDLWHGEQDQNVKIETARFMASKLPNCTPHYFPDEGLISLIGNRFGEILKQFTAK